MIDIGCKSVKRAFGKVMQELSLVFVLYLRLGETESEQGWQCIEPGS